jgi:DNA replication protein DnaC
VAAQPRHLYSLLALLDPLLRLAALVVEVDDLPVRELRVGHDEAQPREQLSQRYERGSTLITSNLPFQEWTEVLGSERLTGALLDRLTHHVHILEMNGDSYRLKQSRRKRTSSSER